MNTMLEVGTFSAQEKIFNQLLENLLKEKGIKLDFFVRLTQAGNLFFPYFEGNPEKAHFPIPNQHFKNESISISNDFLENYLEYVNDMKELEESFQVLVTLLKKELQDIDSEATVSSHFSTYSIHGNISIHTSQSQRLGFTYALNDLKRLMSVEGEKNIEVRKMLILVGSSIQQANERNIDYRLLKLRHWIDQRVKGYGEVVVFEGEAFVQYLDRFGVIPKGYLLALEEGKSDIKRELEAILERHKQIYNITEKMLLEAISDPYIKDMAISKNRKISVSEKIEANQFIRTYVVLREGEKQEVVFVNGERK